MSSSNITNIKLISLDLDDTLLTSKKTISQETIEYLQRLRKKGILLVLNSGRFYHEIEPYAKQLKLDELGGYVISANGQAITDCKTHKQYEFPRISSEHVNAWLKYSKHHHMICYFHDEVGYHFYAQGWQRILFYTAKHIGTLFPILKKHLPKSLYVWNPQPYPTIYANKQIKLCFVGFPFMLRRLESMIHKTSNEYHLFSINHFSKEAVHHTISKKEAIQFLCETEGILLSEVLAFGDSGNDLPLLTSSCIGYAMKNAHASIQKQVLHITRFTNDEDGVVQELKQIFQL